MNSNLDRALNQLRDAPIETNLDLFEQRVWARIGEVDRPTTPEATWRWRAALAAMMLVFGVLVGGAATARPTQVASPFAIHPAFAPSTLLDVRS